MRISDWIQTCALPICGVSEEAVVRGISLILCAAVIIEDTQRVSGFQMRDCNPIPGSGKANLGAQRRQMAKRRSTGFRTEERRAGKAFVSTCSTRLAQFH